MLMRSLAVTTAVLLGSAAPSTAFAQEAQQEHGANAQYTDYQVDAFVTAVGAVATVDEEWRPRIEAAADLEEAQELTAQSQDEMVAAIEDTGISVEDYNEIYVDAQTDPALAERVSIALRERYGDEVGGEEVGG